jgi:Family of unknown function (DUF5681)
MSKSDDPDDKVGYRRPPVATRFQKGQSGNPKGRPRGSQNLASLLVKAGRERVVVNINGKRRSVTKHQAIAIQQTNKAAAGDLSAAKFVYAIVAAEEQRGEAAASRQPVPKETRDVRDRALLAEMLERLKSGGDGGQED